MVESYLARAVAEGNSTPRLLAIFEEALGKLIDQATPFATEGRDPDPLAETWVELASVREQVSAGVGAFAAEVRERAADWDGKGNGKERDNVALQAARQRLHDVAERCRDLTKQIDLGAKLAGRAIDVATKELGARDSDHWASTQINRSRKALEDARRNAVEQLRWMRYFVRQADWLQGRFPKPNFAMSKAGASGGPAPPAPHGAWCLIERCCNCFSY